MTRTLLRRRAPRGLTLVELLIAVALTVMIVGIVAGISVQVQRSIGLSTAREDAARVARNVLDDIERDIRCTNRRGRAHGDTLSSADVAQHRRDGVARIERDGRPLGAHSAAPKRLTTSSPSP